MHEVGVRFVIIGVVAMGLHGSTYLTKDADFAYTVERDNLDLKDNWL